MSKVQPDPDGDREDIRMRVWNALCSDDECATKNGARTMSQNVIGSEVLPCDTYECVDRLWCIHRQICKRTLDVTADTVVAITARAERAEAEVARLREALQSMADYGPPADWPGCDAEQKNWKVAAWVVNTARAALAPGGGEPG